MVPQSTTERCSGARPGSGMQHEYGGLVPRRSRTRLLLAIAFAPALGVSIVAHGQDPLQPHTLWRAWNADPVVVVPLALSAALYLRGLRRLRRGAVSGGRLPWRQSAVFAAGWVCLFVALISPLDALGGVLFSGHMAQHEVLMLLAAPLLVLASPLVVFLWALPLDWRRRVGGWSHEHAVRRAWQALTDPVAAWLLHAFALWAWHIPVLFQATLTSNPVHVLQHLSFFGTAVLFWWSVIHGYQGRPGYGMAVLYVFTTAVHNSMLGALLTFAPTVWYPAYAGTTEAWHLTPLEDQQLGGLIMWVPGGIVYLVAGLVLFAAWLAAAERSPRRTPPHAAGLKPRA
jgi:putative membrane protein